MPVGPQRHPEGVFEVGDRRADFQQHPVGMPGGDGQAVAGGPGDDRRIIVRRGAEPGVEPLRGEVVMILGAGGIIDLIEQIRQGLRVMQRQVDGQSQPGGTVQSAQGLQPGNDGRHVARQRRSRRGLRPDPRDGTQQDDRRNQQHFSPHLANMHGAKVIANGPGRKADATGKDVNAPD